MKLTQTSQIEFEDFIRLDIDTTYFSCGYEKRCTYIYEKLEFNSKKNNVLIFEKENRLNSTDNKIIFQSNQLNNFIELDGEFEMKIFDSLSSYLKDFKKQELNILIDYSSMTKIWFSAFLNYFRHLSNFENKLEKVNLYYSYSHAKYSPPFIANEAGISVEPINGFCNISLPDKPTALIIGLGYDKNMATGLSQYLDADSYIFYSDESYALEYSKKVKSENCALLSEVKPENIYEYPILDINTTEIMLHNVLTDLTQTNRIVLAPCGPKIFSLLCLTESIKLENVDVWRISSSKNASNVSDKLADGKITFYKITFEN